MPKDGVCECVCVWVCGCVRARVFVVIDGNDDDDVFVCDVMLWWWWWCSSCTRHTRVLFSPVAHARALLIDDFARSFIGPCACVRGSCGACVRCASC